MEKQDIIDIANQDSPGAALKAAKAANEGSLIRMATKFCYQQIEDVQPLVQVKIANEGVFAAYVFAIELGNPILINQLGSNQTVRRQIVINMADERGAQEARVYAGETGDSNLIRLADALVHQEREQVKAMTPYLAADNTRNGAPAKVVKRKALRAERDRAYRLQCQKG
jgi:hypothetical protein